MGVVYEAFDQQRQLPVALKTMRSFDPVELYRFKREFRSVSDLAHPNVIALYDLTREDGAWFLAMELVDGSDFLTYVRRAQAPEQPPLSALATAVLSSSAPAPSVSLGASLASEAATGATHGAALLRGNAHAVLPMRPEQRPSLASRLELPRLIEALAQLATGLIALHHAGVIHRDIKSSNALVHRDGRVVITDFGVVAEESRVSRVGLHDRTAGTVAYMAPEQSAGAAPAPASDWYAVGVLLYVALTGSHPFIGSQTAILTAKRAGVVPRRPDELMDDIPAELAALCMQLLAAAPEARPTGAELLDRLGHPLPIRPRRTADFVGRDGELARLTAAFKRACSTGVATSACIAGVAGMGKTRTIEELTLRLSRRPSPPVILMGRCHERESLPFNGLDGVVDDLTLHLATLADSTRRVLISDSAAWISHLFPVFLRLDPNRPLLEAATADETRRVALERFIEVLARLADLQPLVLCVDDWQWADAGSLELRDTLTALRAPIFVVVAERGAQASAAPVDEQIVLQALEPDAQSQLINQLCPAAEPEHAVWSAAGGIPLLLVELAAHVALAGDESSNWDLLEVVRQRVQPLEPAAQRAAELLAIASDPVAVAVLGAALRLEPEERERVVLALRAAGVIATVNVVGDASVEPAHAAVRAALLEHLPPKRCAALHLRLAEALEAWGHAPAAVLMHHFKAGGDPLRAAHYGAQFAADAARQLAFDRAEGLYREALALLEGRVASALRCRLHLALAQNLRMFGGDTTAMAAELEQAEVLAQRTGEVATLAEIFNLRGNIAFRHGDVATCTAAHQRAQIAARSAAAPLAELRAVSGLGDACIMSGALAHAQTHYAEALALAEPLGNSDALVSNAATFAGVSFFLLDWQRGAVKAAEALERARAERLPRGQVVAGGIYSMFLDQRGHYDQALEIVEEALAAARMLRQPRLECAALASRGRALLRLRRLAEARDSAAAAIALADAGHGIMGAAEAYLVLAWAEPSTSKRTGLLDRAEQHARRMRFPGNFLPLHTDGIDIALELGDYARVHRYVAALQGYSDDVARTWAAFFGMRARILLARAADSEPLAQRAHHDFRSIGRELREFINWATELGATAALEALREPQ